MLCMSPPHVRGGVCNKYVSNTPRKLIVFFFFFFSYVHITYLLMELELLIYGIRIISPCNGNSGNGRTHT
jgi:hypothetical protein